MGKEIEVIEAALNDANAKGVYALADSYTIYHALQVIKAQAKFKDEQFTKLKKMYSELTGKNIEDEEEEKEYPQLEGKPKDLKTKEEPIKKKPTK